MLTPARHGGGARRRVDDRLVRVVLEAHDDAAPVLRRIAVRAAEAADDAPRGGSDFTVAASASTLRDECTTRSAADGAVRPHPVSNVRSRHHSAAMLPVLLREPSESSSERTRDRVDLTVLAPTRRSVRPLGHRPARVGRRTRPRPSESPTLSPTLPGEPRQLGHLAGGVGPPAVGREVGAVLGQRSRPPDVAEPAPGHELAQDRQRHSDRRERVVDQQGRRRRRRVRPSRGCRPGPAVAMGTVDVQHVDRSGDGTVGGVGEGGDVADAVGDAGAVQVGPEDLTVAGRLGGEPVDLLWSPVVAGVGIDGDDLDAGVRRPAASTIVERPRKLPISTMRPPARAPGRGCEQPASLVGRSSSRRPRPSPPGPRRPSTVAGRRHDTYTARPNTTTQAAPSSCSTRSLANTSSGAAPRPCSSTSA